MTTHDTVQRATAGRAASQAKHGRASNGPASNALFTLQRAGGNAAVGALLRAGIVGAKLRVAPADDPLEQDADRLMDAEHGGNPGEHIDVRGQLAIDPEGARSHNWVPSPH